MPGFPSVFADHFSFQVGADGTSHSTSKSQAHLRNGMRIATIAAIPFIAYMPAVCQTRLTTVQHS